MNSTAKHDRTTPSGNLPGVHAKIRGATPTAEILAQQLDLIRRELSGALRAQTPFFRSQARAVGITPQQQAVILMLAREDGLSVKSLSERMGLSHSTISGIIDRLAVKRLVSRETDSADRRINRIYLNRNVKKHVRKVKGDIYASVVDRIEAASPRQRQKIVDGLSCLCELLERNE